MYPYNLDSADDNNNHQVYEEMQSPESRQHQFDDEPQFAAAPYPDSGYGPGYKPGPGHGPGPKPGPGYEPGPKPGPGKFPFDDDYNQYQPPDNRPHNAKPTGPPPKYTPKEGASLYAVDPRSIQGCLYSYTYVWLEKGNSFWMYPTNVGRNSIAGYRWTRYGWVYFGMDLDMIQSFYCVPY